MKQSVRSPKTETGLRSTVARVLLAAGAALVASLVLVYWIGLRVLTSNQQLAYHQSTIEHLGRLRSALTDAETGQRGYVLTGELRYLEPYDLALQEIQRELEQLNRFAQSGELSRDKVSELSRLSGEKLAELEQTVKLEREGNSEAARDIVRSEHGLQLMLLIRTKIAGMVQGEEAQFEAASRQSAQATLQRNEAFFVTVVFNLGILVWAYRQITREIRQREAAREELRQSHSELERQVERRTAELTAANKELEAFGYSVSHDLRAPLRHVASYVILLQKGAGSALDEKGRAQVQTIAEAAQRMGHLIDDLLVLSRIGRAAITESEVDLRRLVEDARTELAPEMAGREIEWEIGALPPVRGDASLLRSVVVNLLSNAIKYSRKKNPARIEIGSRQQDGELLCFVRDNGAGFEMQFADKLFGVFQRLHDRDEFEGTGIGLASVRRIIQRHGGRTWAEGAVEQGATFYFSLPGERMVETKETAALWPASSGAMRQGGEETERKEAA